MPPCLSSNDEVKDRVEKTEVDRLPEELERLREELLALEWGDVDLVTGRLVVGRSNWWGKSGRPRTGERERFPQLGNRIIALAGLDAETGIVMLLYLDLAWKELKPQTREHAREAIFHGP